MTVFPAARGDRHQVADPATVLILPRPPLTVVVVIRQTRRTHMGWHIALVVIEPAAQALAIDQQLIQLTGQRAPYVVAHVLPMRLAVEDQSVRTASNPLKTIPSLPSGRVISPA